MLNDVYVQKMFTVQVKKGVMFKCRTHVLLGAGYGHD
mgnify:FL=1